MDDVLVRKTLEWLRMKGWVDDEGGVSEGQIDQVSCGCSCDE